MSRKLFLFSSVFMLLFFGCSNYFNSNLSMLPNFFKPSTPELSIEYSPIGNVILTITIEKSYAGTYEIERAETKDSNGVYEFYPIKNDIPVINSSLTPSIYTDDTVIPSVEGNLYAYRVRMSVMDSFTTSYSNVTEITTKLAPPNLSAELTDYNEATLTMGSNYDGTYRIERAESKDSNGNYIFTVLEENYAREGNLTTYVDKTLSPSEKEKTYAYRVQLKFRENYSEYSEVMYITTKLVPPSLSAELTDYNEATLTIESNYDGIYRIERAESKDSEGNYIFIVLEEDYAREGNLTTYVDKDNVKLDSNYLYRVTLSLNGESSLFSHTCELVTSSVIYNFNVIDDTTTSITYAWDAVSFAESYIIFYATTDDFNQATSIYNTKNNNAFVLQNFIPSVVYYIWVQSLFPDGSKGIVSSPLACMVDFTKKITYENAGSYSFYYDGVKPATVNIYIRGAGGGGQGGSGVTNAVGAPFYIGGGGGGGSVAFASFDIAPNSNISFTVGSGGEGGNPKYTLDYGFPGTNGGVTSLQYDHLNISLNGGAGGGTRGKLLGGSGGNTDNPVTNPNGVILESFIYEFGDDGYDGGNYFENPTINLGKGGATPSIGTFEEVVTGGKGGDTPNIIPSSLAYGTNGLDGFISLTIIVE